MAFDLANLPTDIDALHQIILAQPPRQRRVKRSSRRPRPASGEGSGDREVQAADRATAAHAVRALIGEDRAHNRAARAQARGTGSRNASHVKGDTSAAPGEPSPPRDQSLSDRKKSEPRALPAHLPSPDIVHEPSCTCPVCGGEMRKVGEDVTRILDYIPGHFEVVRHVRPAFSCRRCESMVQSPMPSLPIERGQAGPGVPAHIFVGKYCDHLPLYRQFGIYAREGIELDRTTMATWVGKVRALASPLVEAIANHVMAAEKLHVDDTPVPSWGRAQARPRPDDFGSTRATNACSAAGRRRQSFIAILPIARPNIRARSSPISTAFCRPTDIPASDGFTRCPRATFDCDRGRVLGACAALFLRYPYLEQRADRRRGAAMDRPVV